MTLAIAAVCSRFGFLVADKLAMLPAGGTIKRPGLIVTMRKGSSVDGVVEKVRLCDGGLDAVAVAGDLKFHEQYLGDARALAGAACVARIAAHLTTHANYEAFIEADPDAQIGWMECLHVARIGTRFARTKFAASPHAFKRETQVGGDTVVVTGIGSGRDPCNEILAKEEDLKNAMTALCTDRESTPSDFLKFFSTIFARVAKVDKGVGPTVDAFAIEVDGAWKRLGK